tara:strand:+ start:112 stop:465 length:354 start_codon:yes stop_codon:yes gene_type:complete
MHSDLEILSEMLGGVGESPFGEIIEKNQENSYYSSFGIELLKQFQNNDQYYHFLLSIVSNFKQLDNKQQEFIKNKMEIFPETIIKEKIVYKEKKVNKSQKPKLNMGYSANRHHTDDY